MVAQFSLGLNALKRSPEPTTTLKAATTYLELSLWTYEAGIFEIELTGVYFSSSDTGASKIPTISQLQCFQHSLSFSDALLKLHIAATKNSKSIKKLNYLQ